MGKPAHKQAADFEARIAALEATVAKLQKKVATKKTTTNTEY